MSGDGRERELESWWEYERVEHRSCWETFQIWSCDISHAKGEVATYIIFFLRICKLLPNPDLREGPVPYLQHFSDISWNVLLPLNGYFQLSCRQILVQKGNKGTVTCYILPQYWFWKGSWVEWLCSRKRGYKANKSIKWLIWGFFYCMLCEH